MLSAELKHHAGLHLETDSLQEKYLSIYDLNRCYLGSESCLKKY